MDFGFSPEHLELAEALKRWLATNYDMARRRSALQAGADPLWPMLAEMGITALAVDEAHGGLGGNAVDLQLPLQALGAALAVTPLWSTAVAARALAWSDADGLKRALLPAVASGSLRLALALGERQARHDWQAVNTEARAVPGGFALHGGKAVVLFGAEAGLWLVSARLRGALALFLLPADAPGVHITRYRTLDGLPAADLDFDCAPGAELLATPDAAALLDRVVDHGCALLCAEALGLMESARDATLEHLKTRRQFGAPLASFQALQHRIVDITMQLEQARSLTCLAIARAGSSDVAERVQAVAAAKAGVGEAALHVGRECVQLHGALGLTEEMPVSHALKRLTLIDQTLGDADHHLLRFAALPGFANTEAQVEALS